MDVLDVATSPVIPAEEGTMRRIISLTISGLALVLFCTCVPGAKAQGWTICKVQGVAIRTEQGIRGTVYITGVVPTVSAQNVEAVGKAFAQFITNKYPFPAGMNVQSQCETSPSAAQVMNTIIQPGITPAPGQNAFVDCRRWNTQCVMTDWKDPNAPSAPPAPAPADPCAISGKDLATQPPAGCVPARRAVSPTPPAPPVASAAVNPPPPPRSLPVQNTAPTGTVIVRIIHPIDSSHDPVGTKYLVTVAPGNPSFPPGSQAMVVLTKSVGGGLTLQLISVSASGKTVAVTGGSAAIASTMVRSPAIKNKMSASGETVFVPTQTSLSFVLSATP
jgi:hypothetical protein